MIRFQDGVPVAIWYSQHNNGQAFTYPTVEKSLLLPSRPIAYSARGSHANYAIPGIHDHTIPELNLPVGFIRDYTSQGTLWDPTLNAYFYIYDEDNDGAQTFTPASNMGKGNPTGAMQYKGRWGDAQYPSDDPRQKMFLGFWKFVGGPSGPWEKDLGRVGICLENGLPCIVRTRLVP